MALAVFSSCSVHVCFYRDDDQTNKSKGNKYHVNSAYDGTMDSGEYKSKAIYWWASVNIRRHIENDDIHTNYYAYILLKLFFFFIGNWICSRDCYDAISYIEC